MCVFDLLRVVFNKYGVRGSILLITFVSVILSVTFTALILTTTEIDRISNRIVSGMCTAALVAVVLTPLISYVLFCLILQLENTEAELKVLAQTDALTNVMNRRYLFEMAQKLLINALSYPVSVIIFDLNNFKRVNDNYGHLVGDQMLISFCDSVHGVIRESDFFGRFGGDEFILLLPRTDQQQVIHVLERIRNELELLEIDGNGRGKISLSVSAGVYTGNDSLSASLENFVRKADSAMYKAKEESQKSEGILYYSIFGENLILRKDKLPS
jgi:diguanylate cyclase (GGDEF)-like protein